MVEFLGTVRAVCDLEPVTLATHDRGMEISGRYAFSLYDSMLIASALIAGLDRFYSEDLQHGQLIDGRLRLINPFLKE